MLIELAIGLGLVGARYIYDALTEDDEKKPNKDREVQIPRTDAGAPVPRIYGRCRVRSPVLAWMGPVVYENTSLSGQVVRSVLRANLFYLLGEGFPHGNGISTPLADNHLHAIYAGDHKSLGGLDPTNPVVSRLFSEMNGNGSLLDKYVKAIGGLIGNDMQITGDVEFLNGGPAQQLVNSGALTYAGAKMLEALLTEDDIVSYRDFLSVLMFQDAVGVGFAHGNGVRAIPGYHFEASSYGTNHSRLGTYARVGPYESNPINAIYDQMVSAGVDAAEIDIANFQDVQFTLFTEGHGLSRCFESETRAAENITSILRQIDGVLYKDPYLRLWRIKLIRPDFNPNSIFHITKANCWELEGFVAGNWSQVPNALRLVFEDRDRDYNDNSVTPQNQRNAVDQGGRDAIVVEHRGICRESQALQVASREMFARSRPLAKCRAIMDRTALRVMPGDAVKVTMERWNCAGRIFRVANPEHGTLEDGKIALDLIEDYYYVWRNQTPKAPDSGLGDGGVVGFG